MNPYMVIAKLCFPVESWQLTLGNVDEVPGILFIVSDNVLVPDEGVLEGRSWLAVYCKAGCGFQ